MVIQVESFLCGCSLRSGAITACILTFFVSIIFLSTGSGVIAEIEQAKQREKEMEKEEITATDIKLYEAAGGITLIVGFITFIIFFCLAVGINKNRSRCFIPWLVCYMMNIISSVLNTVLIMLTGTFSVMSSILYILLGFYLWVVVFSYYKEVQQGEDERKTEVATEI